MRPRKRARVALHKCCGRLERRCACFRILVAESQQFSSMEWPGYRRWRIIRARGVASMTLASRLARMRVARDGDRVPSCGEHRALVGMQTSIYRPKHVAASEFLLGSRLVGRLPSKSVSSGCPMGLLVPLCFFPDRVFLVVSPASHPFDHPATQPPIYTQIYFRAVSGRAQA